MKNYGIKNDILKLTTQEDKIYSFNIKTGEIVKVRAPYKTFTTITVVLTSIVFGILLFTIILVIFKKIKNKIWYIT